MDHNVDEVMMVRRLADGTPDHPAGVKRIGSEEATAEADKAQLDAIESNARARVIVVAGAEAEVPEALAGVEDVVERPGVVARGVAPEDFAAPGSLAPVAEGTSAAEIAFPDADVEGPSGDEAVDEAEDARPEAPSSADAGSGDLTEVDVNRMRKAELIDTAEGMDIDSTGKTATQLRAEIKAKLF